MAARPKSICNHPGCGKLIDAPGYCPPHTKAAEQRRAEADARRGTPAERGYDDRWRRARYAFLSEQPLCRACESTGRVTAAKVVDHIIPHKGDRELFWKRSNWQPLCKPCHDAKTAREDGGFGNAVRQV